MRERDGEKRIVPASLIKYLSYLDSLGVLWIIEPLRPRAWRVNGRLINPVLRTSIERGHGFIMRRLWLIMTMEGRWTAYHAPSVGVWVPGLACKVMVLWVWININGGWMF